MWRSWSIKKGLAVQEQHKLFGTINSQSQNSLERWVKSYDDFVGLTAVKNAQSNVIQAETRFIEIQQERREKQHALSTIQYRLKKLNSELEQIPRTDDKYLRLLTEEHAIIKDEQRLGEEVKDLETRERDQFTLLSTALRDSHGKESAQAERTKYWSVAGSLLGACIGIIGTTVNNRLRMKELKSLIVTKETTPNLTDKLQAIELGLVQVNERLSQPVANLDVINSEPTGDEETTANVQLVQLEQEVLQGVHDLKAELVRTAACSLVTVTLLVLLYAFR